MSTIKISYGTLTLRGTTWRAYFKSAMGVYVRESNGHKQLPLAKKWLEERFREEASKQIIDMTGKNRKFEELA